MTVPWQGSFTPANITELIEALCVESSAGRLTFRSGTQMGSLYLLEGQLVDAHYKSLTGLDALAVLLGFEAGEYRFVSGLRSENPNLSGTLPDLFRQALVLQPQQTPIPAQAQPTPNPSLSNSSLASSGLSSSGLSSPSLSSSSVPTTNPPVAHASVSVSPAPTNAAYLPSGFFEEVRALLNDLHVTQPGVVLARAMVGLGDDLSSIPRSRVLEYVRNVETEINPRQAQMFRQSIMLTIDALSTRVNPVVPQSNPIPPQSNPATPSNTASTPVSGLRTVAATLLGRIPGPILSSLFVGEVRQTLEQLRVFNADTAIDRAAENLGFYPSEIPSSHTKKFLTAVIAEITNEQGYQFQQLLDTTIRELEAQGKVNKAPVAERTSPFAFANPLARGKSAQKRVDPAWEFAQSLQQNLKSVVAANSVNGLIQAAATDLGIQASSIAPGYAQKFVQAISQRLDAETAQKFQRTMALSVGVYTAQR